MVGLWAVFAAMLFVIEPLVLHRRLEAAVAAGQSAQMLDRMARFHQVMLALALVTILGAVGGAHGLFV
jgi:hypothetical protein